MDTVMMVFGVFGMIAFVMVLSQGSKISRLERKLRALEEEQIMEDGGMAFGAGPAGNSTESGGSGIDGSGTTGSGSGVDGSGTAGFGSASDSAAGGITMREARAKRFRTYIGKVVKLDFYEEEGDVDIVLAGTRFAKLTLLDVDEEWMLVRLEKGKKTMTKLIRCASVKGITVADEEGTLTC